MRIQNKSEDAHTVNTLSTKFWLRDVEDDWQDITVTRTIAPGEILEIPVTTAKIDGNPFRYLENNIKFDKVYLNLDQNGHTIEIPLSAPTLVPAVSVFGTMGMAIVIAGLMIVMLKRRKTISTLSP